MYTDFVLHGGDERRPAIIFIHGLGMDKNIWIDPSKSGILGGSLPINILLSQKPGKKDYGYSKKRPAAVSPAVTTGTYPENLQTSFADLMAKGYPVMAWSQKRPAGPIDLAVSELAELADLVMKTGTKGIILIGHSRGGLIARRYLMNSGVVIKGLITICTPHRGSSVAKLASYMNPLASLIAPLFSDAEDKGMMKTAMKRIVDFLKSRAIQELLPDSDFFRSLHDPGMKGLPCLTVGGTSPSLFSLYRWKWDSQIEGAGRRWFLVPEEIMAVPDALEKIVPEMLFPRELKKGFGDGLVTAESSRLDWCGNHHNFALNHAQILFDPAVRKKITEAVDSMS